MIKTKLFEGEPTTKQQAIIAFWWLALLGVGILWATTTEFSAELSTILNALGMLFGLLATFFALTQFMLMGRIAWIERQFGLDHLASFHRINGYMAISFILVHPIFVTLSYAMRAHVGVVREWFTMVAHYPFVWLALIAEILFIAVVGSSIYIARKRLKFETWYFVHVAVYVAIVLVPFHQIAVGDSFAGGAHPLARLYWLGLYGFVGLNILIWRFGVSGYNFVRFQFKVDEVVAETPSTTSVYIRGRGLDRLRRKPGQFIFVRIFAKGFWWQEHPFSLSSVADSDRLRLTIRHVGDYTTAIANLKPGARVLVGGPFGRFTHALAHTKKRLFIAGGSGITPFRSLAQEAVEQNLDSVLLYANNDPSDVPLKQEFESLSQRGLKTVYVYANPPKNYQGERGYIDLALIKRIVPDYKTRDIYLCGPPPLMQGLIEAFDKDKLTGGRLHYERFSLHNGS